MKHFYQLKSKLRNGVLFTFILLTICISQISAQTIEKMDDLIAQETGEAKYAKNLFSKQYSTITIDEANISTRGNGSFMVLNTKMEDINTLYSNNTLFREVELINIEIGSSADLSKKIDFSRLASFENLFVINITFTHDACNGENDNCLKNKVQEIIQGNDEVSVLITYKLSLPN